MSKDESSDNVKAQRRLTPPESSKSSSSQQNQNSQTSPQTVTSDVYGIVRDLVLFFCRKIIFGPPQFKLVVSFAIIVIGSLLKSLELSPQSYFSSSKNFFNIYFVKLGWAWTMSLLVPFIYLTLIKTNTPYQIVARHLVRLLVATGVWYVITSLFVHVDDYTGACVHKDMRGVSRRVCVSGGHKWENGIDLSGHTFLLLYTLLIINEEVKSYDKGTKNVNKVANASGDNLANIDQERQKIFTKVIQILYVALAALTILWEFMLLSTALYYHYTSHKIIAAFVAVFFWYITYYVWYRPDSPSLLYPSTPKA